MNVNRLPAAALFWAGTALLLWGTFGSSSGDDRLYAIAGAILLGSWHIGRTLDK